jgi:hypothetical protein
VENWVKTSVILTLPEFLVGELGKAFKTLICNVFLM